MSAGVTVTRADLDAAADLIEAYWCGADVNMMRLAQDTRKGHRQGAFPRAFARHRLATEAASAARDAADKAKIADLEREIEGLRFVVSVIKDPDQRLCCDGRDCGCMGSSIGQYAAWALDPDSYKAARAHTTSEAPIDATVLKGLIMTNEPEWIEHDGSAVCPVPDGHDVEMKIRGCKGALRGRPEVLRWEHDKLAGDITHYRDWTAFNAKQASVGDVPENPPAFPRVGEGFGNPCYDAPGMTLRDWFAVSVLRAGTTVDGSPIVERIPINDFYAMPEESLYDTMLSPKVIEYAERARKTENIGKLRRAIIAGLPCPAPRQPVIVPASLYDDAIAVGAISADDPNWKRVDEVKP